MEKPKKKIFKRWWFWVIAAIVIFSVLGTGKDKPKTVSSSSTQSKEESNSNAPKTFKIGDVIELKDYKVKVNGIRTATQDKAGIIKSEDGKEFLLVDCTIENISKENKAISSIMMFKVVDKDGQECKQTIFPDANGQLDGEVAPTRKIKGEYVVEVPKGKKGLELVFDSSLLTGGQIIVELR